MLNKFAFYFHLFFFIQFFCITLQAQQPQGGPADFVYSPIVRDPATFGIDELRRHFSNLESFAKVRLLQKIGTSERLQKELELT
ncbi:MAG: hypothetical protein AAGA30_04580, partial [Planctomycetota bacterium]